MLLGDFSVGVPDNIHVVGLEYVNAKPGGRLGVGNAATSDTDDVNV